MAVAAFALVFAGALSQGSTVYAEPKLQFTIFENLSEPSILDADAVSAWGLNAAYALHFGADLLASSTADSWLRIALLFPVLILDSALVTTTHEYGHFRAYSRMGIHAPIMVRDADGREEAATPWGVFSLALRARLSGKSLGETYSAGARSEDWNRMISREPYRSHYSEMRSITESSGVNQSQYAAERMARSVEKGVAHPLDGIAYLLFASETARYEKIGNDGGDLVRYASLLRLRGIDASLHTIRNKAQLPKLLSGSFLALAHEGLAYAATGDTEVKPLALEAGRFRFFLPEFASYLTVYGPTVKASKRLEYGSGGGMKFSFLLEREDALSKPPPSPSEPPPRYPAPRRVTPPSSGAEKTAPEESASPFREYTVGFGGETRFFAADLRSTRNKDTGGTWYEAQVAYRHSRSLTLGAKGYRGADYTFAREVKGQIPYFVSDDESGVKVFFELSFPY